MSGDVRCLELPTVGVKIDGLLPNYNNDQQWYEVD
jgi:hypothetical protein